jgi:hypothetical protein
VQHVSAPTPETARDSKTRKRKEELDWKRKTLRGQCGHRQALLTRLPCIFTVNCVGLPHCNMKYLEPFVTVVSYVCVDNIIFGTCSTGYDRVCRERTRLFWLFFFFFFGGDQKCVDVCLTD